VTQLARELGIAPQTVRKMLADLEGVTMDSRNVYWRDDTQVVIAQKYAKLLEFLGYAASPKWIADRTPAKSA
jgi:DNA-binding transcriptional regulator YhcF (GntR family)